jgi:putative membrane protein
MPDFATTDLALAVAHHLLIFALAGVLVFEIAVIRATMTAADIARVGRVDIWYGILAALILAVGFTRAVFAAKGWAYYSVNMFFWAKIGTFAVIGVLSIIPTVAILRWRRTRAADPTFIPPPSAIANVRRFLWAEAVLFALLPAFAAAMARGYGMPA